MKRPSAACLAISGIALAIPGIALAVALWVLFKEPADKARVAAPWLVTASLLVLAGPLLFKWISEDARSRREVAKKDRIDAYKAASRRIKALEDEVGELKRFRDRVHEMVLPSLEVASAGGTPPSSAPRNDGGGKG